MDDIRVTEVIVHKNKLYREWKSTTDDNEYQIMQINFKTYERIVKNKIEETKQKYYFDKFTAQKNDMKKTWATIIDETLNRKRKSTEYPAEFFYNSRTIRDSRDIANSFNEYFSSIGPSLSVNIDVSGQDKSYRPISRVVIGREVDYRSRLIYVRYCLTNTTLCL